MFSLIAGETAKSQYSGSYPRPPNRAAQEITGRLYLSHSQLSCMRTCPRQFAFRYVEKAPADFVPGGLLFGACIHSAIEYHFLAVRDGRDSSQEELLSAYDEAWRRKQTAAESRTPVRLNNGDTADTLHALADRMLAAFLDSLASRPDGEITGVEEELRIVLDEDLPDILARMDLVVEDQTGLTITDFKTSRSRWSPDKAIECAEQLLLYATAVRQRLGTTTYPANLQFAVLTKTRQPVVQVLPVIYDSQRVASLRDNVSTVWKAIRSGHFYPNPSPMNCSSTCPYRSRCPIFGGT